MTIAVLVGLLVAIGVSCALTGPAFALSEGRVYEMVSPVYKGGYGARLIAGVAPDGEGVVFGSFGAFAGAGSSAVVNYYQASRGPAGWSSVSLMPPASVWPFVVPSGVAPSLGASLWLLKPAANVGRGLSDTEVQLAVHRAGAPDSEAGFEPVGPVLRNVDGSEVAYTQQAASDDFCHVVLGFSQGALLLSEPTEVTPETQLYDVSAGCRGESSSLRLVALRNSGMPLSPDCNVQFGDGEVFHFNALSADGNAVFFKVSVPSGLPCSGKQELFVRLGGGRTLEVSRPLDTSRPFGGCVGEEGEVSGELPCKGAAIRAEAAFEGASEDGSRVFFSSPAPLVSQAGAGQHLYMATIGCPAADPGCSVVEREVTSLVLVSNAVNPGEESGFQRVVRVARDGSRVYFTARGVLSEAGPASEGVQSLPVSGAENLYVYEAAVEGRPARTSFIADLCTGPSVSGAVGDSRCPSDLSEDSTGAEPRNDESLWTRHPRAQTAGLDGRFLVFTSYGRLITEGSQADADDAQDVYRYDALTGQLVRVSLGEAGRDANGNQNDVGETRVQEVPVGSADARIQLVESGAQQDEEHKQLRRAVSEDGSRVVFSTFEPLSASASNGLMNVYEWHAGSVSMISTGSALENDEEPVITASGGDVFFTSVQGLVSQDTDGAPDIYDARLGGGFPQPPAPSQPCSGDACQGSLTNPAPLLVPGSVPQLAGENASSPKPSAVAVKGHSRKASVKTKRHKKHKRKHVVRARHARNTLKSKRSRP